MSASIGLGRRPPLRHADRLRRRRAVLLGEHPGHLHVGAQLAEHLAADEHAGGRRLHMTIVMVMGDFDFSVGSMASLAGVVAAVLFAQGFPVGAGVGAALAVGLAGGLINGFLVSIVGILPFVVTLGTLTVFSGSPSWRAAARPSSAAKSRRPSAASRAAASTSICSAKAGRAALHDARGTRRSRPRVGRAGADRLRPPPLRDRRQCEAARLAGVKVRSLRLIAFS